MCCSDTHLTQWKRQLAGYNLKVALDKGVLVERAETGLPTVLILACIRASWLRLDMGADSFL